MWGTSFRASPTATVYGAIPISSAYPPVVRLKKNGRSGYPSRIMYNTNRSSRPRPVKSPYDRGWMLTTMSVPSLRKVWGDDSSTTDGTASASAIVSFSGGPLGFFQILPR